MKGYRRHKFLFRFLRVTVLWIFYWLFRFQTVRIDSDEPFLLIANHVTNFDPIFIGAASKKHLYFVASDHVLRGGFASNLLKWVFNPIARMKGGTDAQAAMTIIRTIRKGANVCLFAEGNRTYNGVTCPIFSATGKLVKSTGAKLITYKLIGGYFSSPRWSRSFRRGKMTGEVMGEYSAAQLKEMTADEVNDLLVRDLYEDAYARQEAQPVAYNGRNLAEYLETAIYVCPKCGAVDSIHSKGNDFWCASCDLRGTYSAYGTLAGENLPFSTVTQWDQWQETQLPGIAETLREKPLQDDDVTLLRIGEKHKATTVTQGTLKLYHDRLICGEVTFPLKDIGDMALVARSRIMLNAGGVGYEIRPNQVCCGRKYFALFQLLKKQQS